MTVDLVMVAAAALFNAVLFAINFHLALDARRRERLITLERKGLLLGLHALDKERDKLRRSATPTLRLVRERAS